MAQVGERSLNPPVAPIPVHCSHANDQVLNLIASSGSTRAAALAAIVFLGDQPSVPGQEGFRRDDGGDFTQQATPQRFGLGGQAAALIIV